MTDEETADSMESTNRDPQSDYMQDVIVVAMASLERLRMGGYVQSDFGGSPLTAKGHAHAIEARGRRPGIPLDDIRAALAAAEGRYGRFADIDAIARTVHAELDGRLPDLEGGTA